MSERVKGFLLGKETIDFSPLKKQKSLVLKFCNESSLEDVGRVHL